MGNWLADHGLDLLQTVGIVGSLLIGAYAVRKDERARRIGHSIAIADQHRQIWRETFRHPELARILTPHPDLEHEPISIAEETFVKMLFAHLSTVFRAMEYKEFVKLEGLDRDVEAFLNLPIPRLVWQKFRSFHDSKFIEFVEHRGSLHDG